MKKQLFYCAILFLCLAIGFSSCNPEPTHYESMPPAEDFDKELSALLVAEEIGDDPEYFGLGYYFTDLRNPPHNKSSIFADIYVSSKNKIFNYDFSIVEHRTMGRGEGVSLQSGRGDAAVDVNDYEDYKHVLFKRSDFPSGSDLNKLFEVALEKASSKIKEPSIVSCSFSKNGAPQGEITIGIGTKGSPSARGKIYFDAKGNHLKSSLR